MSTPLTTLALRVAHRAPAPDAGPPAAGPVTIAHGESRAFLLTPATIDPARPYPLVTVLHGAGRQDDLLVRAYRDEPDRRGALFLVVRSYQPTWDLIVGGPRDDLDFLEHSYAEIYARYRVDPARQALLGYSDGASYALAVGLSNPRLFAAVMGWAAGFLVIDTANLEDGDPKPRVLLEYGTEDPLFPFAQVALPMRAALERLGYSITFRADEGGVHWPSPAFQPAALDWFLGPRSLTEGVGSA
jgi:predicted esterase